MPFDIGGFLSAQIFFFIVLALGALGSAIVMVLNPNPVRSALFLVINLFCVAGLYLLLNAYFLAAVQVIVYAGAIMVLFLFVIMLLNLGSPDRTVDELRWQQPVAVVIGLVLALVISWTVYSSLPLSVPVAAVSSAGTASGFTPDTMGTVQGVGGTLYNGSLPWLFPFEMTSILLLIATIGSVVLAQRRVIPQSQEGAI